MKTIIERGASWTLEETKLLLSLWGQDLVQRKVTCQKRTKEVYEKISEKFNQNGYERTADQVRTRVFNMIAEYRRILRDPSPERMKKCIFFEALHRIYQAKHMDDVKSALDDYEPECPYSPSSILSNTISSERGDESVSDSEAMDETLINNARAGNETETNASSANSTKKNNASATSDLVNDSINNNNDNSTAMQSSGTGANKQVAASTSDKEGSSANQSAKKIKLEPAKAGSSHVASDSNETPASKQKGSSSAATAAGAGATNATSSASSTNNISGSRHQSLLLPQTATSVSSPISKLTNSGSNNTTPAYINVSSSLKNVMGATRIIGHANGNEQVNLNGTPTANRLPTSAAITSHQFYQAPVNTFDVTSSALLIDRMFSHLSRESENMREWIALEKDRIALERARRVQDSERDSRRERVLIDTLMKFQEQWLSFITKLEPRLVEKYADQIPTLKLPPGDAAASETEPKVAKETSSVAVNTSGSAANSVHNTTASSSSNNTSSSSNNSVEIVLSSSTSTQSTGSAGSAPSAISS